MQKFVSVCLMLAMVLAGVFYMAEPRTQTVTEIEQDAIVTDSKQIECLAKNIYYESRGEPKMGQIVVARVVMNRAEHPDFGDTPCEVIYDHAYVKKADRRVKVCQFSWACDSSQRRPNPNDPVYQRALALAYDVIVNDAYADLVPKSVLYFHNRMVFPGWRNVELFRSVGNHVFYKEKPRRAR